MSNAFDGKWWPEFWHTLVSVVFLTALAADGWGAQSGVGQSHAGGRMPIHSGIWMGSGLHHFPPVWLIPAYPWIQWMYPCFPYVNCLVFHQHQRLDRRRQELQKPTPVFGLDATVLSNETMDAWRASLRPAREPFRTDERDIHPEFLGHSLVRPEFEGAGRVLPQFLMRED